MSLLRQLLIDDCFLTGRRCALVALWIVLAILTHIPVPQSAPEIRNLDKLVHLIAYFPLGLLLPTCRVRRCQSDWACVLVIALYGIFDELLQLPVGRTASVFDWVADTAGATLGVLTTRLLAQRG